MFAVLAALIGLAALPAFPQTETASVALRPAETENARSLLGENLSGNRDQVASRSRADDAEGRSTAGAGQLTLSIPRLGLEDVAVPTGDSQVKLDREGIMRLKGTGVPSKRGSNTVIVGHAMGFVFTRVPYVFYELDQMKPGDEIQIETSPGREYTYRVYDLLTVRPEDYWVTYPVPDRTIVSLQTCTPIPTFEKRLIVRAELVG